MHGGVPHLCARSQGKLPRAVADVRGRCGVALRNWLVWAVSGPAALQGGTAVAPGKVDEDEGDQRTPDKPDSAEDGEPERINFDFVIDSLQRPVASLFIAQPAWEGLRFMFARLHCNVCAPSAGSMYTCRELHWFVRMWPHHSREFDESQVCGWIVRCFQLFRIRDAWRLGRIC